MRRIAHISRAPILYSYHVHPRYFSKFRTKSPVSPPVGVLRGAPSSSSSLVARGSASLDVLSGATLEGQHNQVATIHLSPSQQLKVDPASILSMQPGVDLQPVAGFVDASPPGRFSFRSSPAVTSPTLASITCSSPAAIQLAPEYPARLHRISLSQVGGEIHVRRGAFLAGGGEVQLQDVPSNTHIAGMQLQKINGHSHVWLKVRGVPIEKHLAPGESYYVQGSRIVSVESSVQLFGGEGVLMTQLVGPGTVLLQSNADPAMQAAGSSALPGVAGGSSVGFAPQSLGATLAEGMAFGVGSAVAHRAVDSLLGPRQIEHVHTDQTTNAQQPPPTQQPEMYSDLPADNNEQSGGGFFDSLFGDDDGDGDGGDD